MTSSGVPIVRLVIRHGGQWVDGSYKGGESRMRGVKSDLSFVGLMKLVEDVVGVNLEIDEIVLHALISTPGELSLPIIKDDEDVALILLEQRNVSAMYVSIKGCQTNVMSRGEVGQHGNQLNQNEIYNASHIPQHSVRNPQQWQLRYAQEFVQPGRQTTFIKQLAAQFRSGCASNQFLTSLEQMQQSGETVECVMPLSNENTTVEDNNVRLKGDTATLEYNIAFDIGNEDLFTVGETKPVGGVDVGDVQCDDPIYNNPITGENGIRSLDTLLDDSDKERGNAGVSHTWVIAGAERFFFQTITTEESTCAEDRLYEGRMFSSKAEFKRALNMLVIKEKFAIRVKRSCKARYEFPTTSAKMIGELMSHKIRANGAALRPKDIICEMRVQWGLECLYGKAWQAKKRYQMMTSNIAECVNSCLKYARQMPITVLIEFIKDMFQRWFHERYEEAVKVTTPLSPWVARQLSKRFNDAHRFLVKPINRVEFEVKDGKMDGLVNLSRKTCSCCEFQTDLLPCSHAIAAISKCNREAIEFCTNYYKTTIFVEGYLGSIRPIGHPSEWDSPPHVKQIIVLPPPWRGQAGRPRRRRIPSAGEGNQARRWPHRMTDQTKCQDPHTVCIGSAKHGTDAPPVYLEEKDDELEN
ncbi:Uncharacterized protein TCM_032532 [Theobroma cacao]|uniref:SWIM-type domain-containing protein n=1 Tax=Theobroma cacao TaxID=3641 RepID=A0A061FAV6_THECC|nr:Uncharacterized protein TCM_032532 [Theobroma cacao]